MMIKAGPAGWGTDNLLNFLDFVRNNQFASFQQRGAEYTILCDVDGCFSKLVENLVNPKDVLAPLFIVRSHSAYRTACGTALAGQSPEAFALLRLCVESAGYALLIHQSPALGEVWLNRSHDKKAVQREFTLTAMRSAIEVFDKKLAGIFDMLYARAIDFGAHPNEMASTGSMAIIEGNDRKTYVVKYLDDNPLVLAHAMKSSAQAGLCALFLFQRIFPGRFELLGIRAKMEKLRAGL